MWGTFASSLQIGAGCGREKEREREKGRYRDRGRKRERREKRGRKRKKGKRLYHNSFQTPYPSSSSAILTHHHVQQFTHWADRSTRTSLSIEHLIIQLTLCIHKWREVTHLNSCKLSKLPPYTIVNGNCNISKFILLIKIESCEWPKMIGSKI